MWERACVFIHRLRRTATAGSTKLPLVNDVEGSLRHARKLKAEEGTRLKMLPQHPQLTPNLNAITSIWDLLQDRLLLTEPVEMESRQE